MKPQFRAERAFHRQASQAHVDRGGVHSQEDHRQAAIMIGRIKHVVGADPAPRTSGQAV